MFPNGDLLALYSTPHYTPSGMGLAKVDKDGNPVWVFDGHCHHDFTLRDEKIYVLTHELQKQEHIFKGSVCLEDFVLVLSEDGKVQQKFSLMDLYYNSPYYRRDIVKRDGTGDVLHANTVNLVSKEFAAHYPEVDASDLMMCFRNIKSLAYAWKTSF